MSQDQIVVDRCEARWDANKSDCSGFVKAVASDLGITLTGDADAIVDQIHGPGWTPLPNGAEAKTMADAGYFVVGGKKKGDLTPPRDHGHVVVVVAGPLAAGRYPSAYWGKLGGVGDKNKTINWAFNDHDRDSVVYGYRAFA